MSISNTGNFYCIAYIYLIKTIPKPWANQELINNRVSLLFNDKFFVLINEYHIMAVSQMFINFSIKISWQ